jgi:hypothetical protein
MLIKRLAKIKSSNRKYLMKDGVLEHHDEQMLLKRLFLVS